MTPTDPILPTDMSLAWALLLFAPLATGCAEQPWSSAQRFPVSTQAPAEEPRPMAPSSVGPAPAPPDAHQEARDPAALALAFARERLGAPYCWGGTGPQCYDCSGFTRAAWGAAGHVIPRTSAQQVEQLRRVPLDRLRPGDIVWRPGHVALYLGSGKVINATKPGDVVKIQPLAGYIKAVRPY